MFGIDGEHFRITPARVSSKPKAHEPLTIIGLMSGTSADGIDAVVAEISGAERRLRAHVVAHAHERFPPALRRRILRVGLHGRVAEICELNFALGEKFAQAALKVIHIAKLRTRDITAIASHGQTIHHLPNARTPSTLQIGELAVIAERTGIRTIGDFRVRDMAAGGQGAPLVPYADWTLFTHDQRPRIIQNIGGIGNLTFLPPRARLEEVTAFDTGPGNMVIDAVVTHLSGGLLTFDRGGKLAAQGNVSEKLVTEMMSHPFLRRSPPKTTGREEFGEVFVEKVLRLGRRLRLLDKDLVASATAFTAASIADAYRRFIFPQLGRNQSRQVEIILGGGGAMNPTLRRMLACELGKLSSTPNPIQHQILTHKDFGIENAAKEALAFAILGYETLHGRPSNVPNATGAGRPVILGKIVNV
jgi:anhydro-N-acetylmuramic acid kinase